MNDLKVVNTKGNLLEYESEVEDDWTPAKKKGDCDSIATWKMARLVQYGWPEKSMRLACCFVEPSAGPKPKRYHLVLLVDFEGTTYVLCNRYALPMEWNLVPYEWHKIWNHELNAWEWAKDADRTFT
jgi:predicted transglutaminase-like cysteine proteinase